MSKKIRTPDLSAEGWGRNQPVIPSEMSSEVTSWLLCVSILTRESSNWGGSGSGHNRGARREKGEGPTVPLAPCWVLDMGWLIHYINIPTNNTNTEGARD